MPGLLVPIRDWPVDERPRERLRARGPRSLATRELIALLVGSGSGRAGNVLHIADALLRIGEGSLRRLSTIEYATLLRVPGVGEALATRILAAFELGRRAAADGGGARRTAIRGPADVHRLMGARLRDLRQEEFHVLLLDARHRVTRRVLATRGTLDASLIHPREVFRAAIAEGAAGLVLVHNHPSGDPAPSPEDRAVTRQLVDSGRVLGIPVLDHVIIGDGTFTSLSDEGLL